MVLPQDMTFSPPRSHFSPPGVGPSHRQKDNLSPKGMIWYPQLPPSLQKLRRFLPQSTHVSSRQRSEVRPPKRTLSPQNTTILRTVRQFLPHNLKSPLKISNSLPTTPLFSQKQDVPSPKISPFSPN
ncbi:Uncharacterised protein [Chlamydia abortus]|nr:Uncharacterised protein [Chlamydia abortus]SGA23476.1 Uncharacterised protein [Chlamydia abortus]SGA24742.1 Uncharacterised protein [Chlamydia abortus]